MPDVSIIIGIDKPREDLCFVITPYRLPLERLIDAVVSVAAEKHLTPILNRNFATKKDWTADIRDCTRRAKIVIALGCVDAASRRSHVVHRVSENVMYELGLAHALAKPTLVVWDSKVALPADICIAKWSIKYTGPPSGGKDVAPYMVDYMTSNFAARWYQCNCVIEI